MKNRRFFKTQLNIVTVLTVLMISIAGLLAPVVSAAPYPTRIPCTGTVGGQPVNPLLVPSCAVRELPRLAIYIFNMAIITAVVTALVFLIIAGYLYITAEDDTRQQEKARDTIKYAIIGLIIAGSAYILLRTFSQPFNVDIFSSVVPKAYAQEITPTPVLENDPTPTPQSLVQLSGKIKALQTKEEMAGVTATLFWLNNGRWEVWPAQQFNNQRNPYPTDIFGQYQFFVPSGQYYIELNKVGYFRQVTEVIEIKTASVAVDVYLKQATTIWIYLLIVGVVAFFSSLAYIIIQKIVEWRKHEEMRSLVRRQIRGNDQNGTDSPRI